MAQADGDPRVGSTLAGYRLGARLGRGGMGIVYRAEHLRLGRAAALKVVLPELADDARFRGRFAREAQIAATLDHPHVVSVYDAGEEAGVLYLAMQLIEGGDLAAELSRGALAPARALEVCEQVGEALDAAHARGLIHRDVKPANVLLDRRGAYLSDFGLAGLARATTRGGEVVGTAHYVAPEQIEDSELDGRADQYALAAVLHHCLCGAPPFERGSEAATLNAHLRDAPPRASERRRGLPAALDGVLARGLDKAPRRRFESCGALIAAAREALEAAGPLDLAPARTVPAEGDDPSVITLTELPRPAGASDAATGSDRRARVLLAGVGTQTRALAKVAVGRGVEIREVPDGEAALAAARASLPDLLLLDWRVPGQAAADTIAALRADPATRGVKVMLAVDWQVEGSADVRAAGADETLGTPFSALQLQVKLRRLLGTEAT